MDELDDRQMHKVVTKEWRKTERAETSQNLVFCFSCRDNSMAWVPCPSDNVWYKYIWTCFPISFCWCTFLWGKKWKWKYVDKHSKESAKLKNAQIYASATGAASSGPCVTSFECHAAPLGQPKYYRSIPGHVRSRVTRPIREMPCAPSHNTNMWTLCVKKALKT